MRSNRSAAGNAGMRRDGTTLVFAGALLRDGVAALWTQAGAPLDGVTRFDLREVERVDSAGLALLAELAARSGTAITLDGAPEGLAELSAAYRLNPSLGFAS